MNESGESFDRDAFNLEQGYPDGSLPSVPGPNPVPTGNRRGSSEIYAEGGKPGAKAAPWLIEAQQWAKDRADAKAHKKKQNS
ncbi:MAG: hypothetical protein ACXWLH_01855 [Candidatus Saccharimonadales bacterium]